MSIVYVIFMSIARVETKFEPNVLKAKKRNEATLFLSLSAADGQRIYWCECDIVVNSPLSLAHDKELNLGRTRIGILKQDRKIEKQVKLYTSPATLPDNYPVNITAYLYDEDGAIAERVELRQNIKCEE